MFSLICITLLCILDNSLEMDHITLITITNSDLNQSHAILGENISDTTIDVHKKYLLSWQKEETQFSMHNKYLLSRQKKHCPCA